MPYCINCKKALSQKYTEFGLIYNCNKCSSKMVNASVLKKKHIKSELFHEMWSNAKHDTERKGRKCPSCFSVMSLQNFQHEDHLVEIDICTHCFTLWFDTGEYEEVPLEPVIEKIVVEDSPEVKLAQAKLDIELFKFQRNLDKQDSKLPPGVFNTVASMLGFPFEDDDQFIQFYAFTTWLIAAAMIAIFCISYHDLRGFLEIFGFVPDEWFKDFGVTIISSFFMHASVWHLIGNVYFLMLFGDNVEDDVGRMPFVVLLTISHLVGVLLHSLFDPNGHIPVVGASAGISGVVAYYSIMFPKKKLGFFIRVRWKFAWYRIPVWLFFSFWVLMQILIVRGQLLGQSDVSGLGHLGGILVGVFIALYVKFGREERAIEDKIAKKYK
jgi:membrane associated rhomboid family serine protease/Zn-finger nucleic acid-binding protein